MAIMRAVVKGTLFDTVQVRNMFTADVTPAGGDTSEDLWTAYLQSIYTEVASICNVGFKTATYEMQAPLGSQWETLQEVPFVNEGDSVADYLPNQTALVLIGKAAGIRHLGRKFFSGLSESASTGNGIATLVASTVAAALLAYITPFTGIGGGIIQPGIRTAGGTFYPFVGGFASSLLGSMRRRKPGIGN